MAHKTIVDGTVYAITGGKCMVDGTVYEIKNGKTLIDGTGYSIEFKAATAQLTLDFVYEPNPNATGVYKIIPDDSTEEGTHASELSIISILGKTYNILSEDTVLEVPLGTQIYLTLQVKNDGEHLIFYLNNEEKYSGNPKYGVSEGEDHRQYYTLEINGVSQIYYRAYPDPNHENINTYEIRITGDVTDVTPPAEETTT